MIFSKQQVLEIYRRRAGLYDLTANLYRLLGFREAFYRHEAVAALGIEAGDTVVEMCCGTGLNFPLLQDAVGPKGKIVGVDFSDAMLARAEQRVARNGWKNVELIESDAVAFRFPETVNGILSTFAITLVPEFDAVIARGAGALKPGGRWVVLDLKKPLHWPEWLIRFYVWLTKPFGVTLDLAERHPRESIRRYVTEVVYREYYFGCLFLSAGESRGSELPDTR